MSMKLAAFERAAVRAVKLEGLEAAAAFEVFGEEQLAASWQARARAAIARSATLHGAAIARHCAATTLRSLSGGAPVVRRRVRRAHFGRAAALPIAAGPAERGVS